MKKTIILIFAMISILADMVSAQSEWTTATEKYNGEEYRLEFTEYTYSITNQKYVAYLEHSTSDCRFDNETDIQYEARRYGVAYKIYSILNEIFHFDDIPQLETGLNTFCVNGIYDSKTKNFIGAEYIFETENKNYFPLEKIQQAETEILQAGINMGKSTLSENLPYFTYFIVIRLSNAYNNESEKHHCIAPTKKIALIKICLPLKGV